MITQANAVVRVGVGVLVKDPKQPNKVVFFLLILYSKVILSQMMMFYLTYYYTNKSVTRISAPTLSRMEVNLDKTHFVSRASHFHVIFALHNYGIFEAQKPINVF